MNPEDYRKEQLTIDMAKANRNALLITIPTLLAFGIPYFLVWQEQFSIQYISEAFKGFSISDTFGLTLSIFLVTAAGIIIHELIHGIFFALYAENGFRAIRFGIMWKALAPYCHCKDPLKLKHYRIGAVMPAILLGILPGIVSIFIGSLGWLLFGILFTVAAIGDFMILDLLKNEDKEFYVQDHPSEAGCYIYRPKDVLN